MKRSIFGLLPALLIIILAAGCSDDDPASPSGNNDGLVNPATDTQWLRPQIATFDVEWTDNTVYFDSTQIDDFLGIDTTDGTYHFSAESATASSLNVGDVLMIYGTALVKVKSVSEEDGAIVVEVEDAVLTDAVKNGTISWDYQTSFSSAETPTPKAVIGGKEVAFDKVGADNFSLSYKIGEYKYTFAMTFGGDEASVAGIVEKKFGEYTSGEFKVEGSVKPLHSKNKIVIQNGQVQEFDHQNANLQGELVVSMGVEAEAGGTNIGFDFPAVLLKYPFLVGPIPVVLNVKSAVGIYTTIPLGGSADVSASFTYDSEAGFNYNGVDVNVNGQLGTVTVENNEAKTSAPSPIVAEFAVAFPKIELSILGKTLVPYVQSTMLIRGDFSPPVFGEPQCHNARATFAGVAGYNFGILGVGLAKDSWQLWAKEIELLKEGCD